MSKQKEMLDAVKTAKSIHEGDYSSLRDKSFLIIDNSDKIKKKNDHHPGGKIVKKPTLSQRMDKLDRRIDRIEESITNLAKIVSDGFKRVNKRIDNLEKDINTRLDYIVKANNLKDSK